MKRHKIHHFADIVGRCKKGIIPFLLCFVFMGYGQNISVNFPNITVERALEILRNQEGYSFSVKTNDVNLRQKVNADLQNQPIEKVLETIFQNQPVSFEIEGKMVRIIKAPEKDSKQTGSTAESKKISGRVTDKQGDPLIGVSIIAKGANKGTITNIDGYYSLTVPDKSVIQFSYVGYDTQELKLGKGNILNATLQEKINDLDEVVVIGYGSMKKKRPDRSCYLGKNRRSSDGSQHIDLSHVIGKSRRDNIGSKQRTTGWRRHSAYTRRSIYRSRKRTFIHHRRISSRRIPSRTGGRQQI